MTREIGAWLDVIDSREVIERIEELRSLPNRDRYDQVELSTLLPLAEQGDDCSPEWEDGATLIRYDYFPRYAREFAEGISEMDYPNAVWPLNCIDWRKAAEELQKDYTAIDFNGVTYWIR